jgi:hypothetical protein
MPIPGEQPDLSALPPESSPVKRRLAAQYVCDARDRLTSSSGTRPAFDYELLRQYAQTRLSASLIILLLVATIGLLSSLWTGAVAAGAWTASVLVIHAVMITKCRQFPDLPMAEVVARIGAHAIPAYKEYSGDIHNSGVHLLGLINEILDLSRIEAGRYELNEESVSLTAIVEDCYHLLKIRASNRGITIHEAFEPDLPRLWADERAIRREAAPEPSPAVPRRYLNDCVPPRAIYVRCRVGREPHDREPLQQHLHNRRALRAVCGLRPHHRRNCPMEHHERRRARPHHERVAGAPRGTRRCEGLMP